MLSLSDAILLGALGGQGESSSEILCSLVLTNGDADLVGHLGGVEATIGGEGRGGPVPLVPTDLLGIKALGETPKFVN